MADFTYLPTTESQVNLPVSLRKLTYGDGYEARYMERINPISETWDLTFIRNSAIIDEIETFLLTNKITPFNWTSPTGISGKWEHSGYEKQSLDGDRALLKTSFMRVFGV